MIDDLEKRAAFWGSLPVGGPGGGSFPTPFIKHQHIFNGTNVLEIGPGDGRQFDVLSKVASRYTVADISSAVLAKPQYSEVTRLLITSYNTFLRAFDVVTCWYVFHHVKKTERTAFLNLVRNHLERGGYFYFNVPDENHPDAAADDGIGTTALTRVEIDSLMVETGFKIEDTESITPDCLCILAKPR